MGCTHEKVRCTDGIFYCLLCGQRIDYPPMVEVNTEGAEKGAETAKKGGKRKKKEGK